MINTQMEDCCGVQLIHAFGFGTGIQNQRRIDRDLYECEIEAIGDCQAFTVALLNDRQVESFGEVLKARGWKLVNKSVHADHKSIIFCFIKNYKYRAVRKGDPKVKITGAEDLYCTSRILAPGEMFAPKPAKVVAKAKATAKTKAKTVKPKAKTTKKKILG